MRSFLDICFDQPLPVSYSITRQPYRIIVKVRIPCLIGNKSWSPANTKSLICIQMATHIYGHLMLMYNSAQMNSRDREAVGSKLYLLAIHIVRIQKIMSN